MTHPAESARVASPTPDAIDRAAALLAAGELVVFPTETVYGLGADARSDAAVAKIYAAKARPSFNPLIAHVADFDAAAQIAALDARAEALAKAFWPGPLTLVAPLRAGGVSALCAAGLATVAVRAPAHAVAQALLRRFGGPVAAPSANPSGKLSPTTADAAARGLAGRVAMTLDGGPTEVGVESTIIGLDGGAARLLRPGGLAREALEDALGARLVVGPATAAVTAPGQLASHYAPGALLRLNAAAPRADEAWLGFGPDPTAARAALARETLSASGDLAEAAARLFSALGRLDAALAGGGRIAVAPIPPQGLGLAINDRLRRAAAPRG